MKARRLTLVEGGQKKLEGNNYFRKIFSSFSFFGLSFGNNLEGGGGQQHFLGGKMRGEFWGYKHFSNGRQ